MNLLRLFVGPRDYGNVHCIAIALLGVELELAKGRTVGYYVSLEWHWFKKVRGRWIVMARCEVFYADWLTFWWDRTVRAPLRRWWEKCAWNADRLEDPFQ